MRKEMLATGGAIGASLAIASCCVAPTLFLLFGVSVGSLGLLAVGYALFDRLRDSFAEEV